MIRTTLAMAAILGGAVLIGCDSKSDDVKPPTPTAAPPKPQADVTPPATPATPAVPAATATPATPATPAAPAANAADADAQAQITQIMQYIKDNKLDLAQKGLDKLDGMRASLSPALQTQLDNAHKALDAAKSMGGGKMPEMPAMPK